MVQNLSSKTTAFHSQQHDQQKNLRLFTLYNCDKKTSLIIHLWLFLLIFVEYETKTYVIKLIYKYRIFLSVFIYLFLFISTLHLYRYRFDVDGIGSMMIALRVQSFDFFRSINGVWSPLNSWLAALFPGLSSDPVLVFKIINAVCCSVIILLLHRLSKHFIQITTKSQMLFSIGFSFTLPIILLSFTHYQLSGDLLQLCLVLLYMLLILREDAFSSLRNNILVGLIIAFACYAKAFNLPFLFISHFAIVLITYYTSKTQKFIAYVKPLFITYVTAAIFLIPWMYILYTKYGVFTFSTVQTFNFLWLLNDHSYTVLKSADLLQAPPYPDSPTMWEDPYIYYNYNYSGPLASVPNFLHFIKNIFHNFKILFRCSNELSFLSISIFVFYLLNVLKNKEENRKIYILLFLAFFIAFGYTLIYIEVRYIWLTGFLLLIIGSKYVVEKLSKEINSNAFFLVSIIFFGSFILTPIDYLQDMRNKGKDLIETSSFLKENNLKGNFTALNGEEGYYQELAFISKNQLFQISQPGFSYNDLIQSCRKNNIQFIICNYRSNIEENDLRNSELAKISKSILKIPNQNAFIFTF